MPFDAGSIYTKIELDGGQFVATLRTVTNHVRSETEKQQRIMNSIQMKDSFDKGSLSSMRNFYAVQAAEAQKLRQVNRTAEQQMVRDVLAMKLRAMQSEAQAARVATEVNRRLYGEQTSRLIRTASQANAVRAARGQAIDPLERQILARTIRVRKATAIYERAAESARVRMDGAATATPGVGGSGGGGGAGNGRDGGWVASLFGEGAWKGSQTGMALKVLQGGGLVGMLDIATKRVAEMAAGMADVTVALRNGEMSMKEAFDRFASALPFFGTGYQIGTSIEEMFSGRRATAQRQMGKDQQTIGVQKAMQEAITGLVDLRKGLVEEAAALGRTTIEAVTATARQRMDTLMTQIRDAEAKASAASGRVIDLWNTKVVQEAVASLERIRTQATVEGEVRQAREGTLGQRVDLMRASAAGKTPQEVDVLAAQQQLERTSQTMLKYSLLPKESDLRLTAEAAYLEAQAELTRATTARTASMDATIRAADLELASVGKTESQRKLLALKADPSSTPDGMARYEKVLKDIDRATAEAKNAEDRKEQLKSLEEVQIGMLQMSDVERQVAEFARRNPLLRPEEIEKARQALTSIDLVTQAKAMKEALMTPAEKYAKAISDLDAMRKSTDANGNPLLSDQQYAAGVEKAQRERDGDTKGGGLAGFIRGGSADAAKYKYELAGMGKIKDELPKAQFKEAQRQTELLAGIKDNLKQPLVFDLAGMA